MKMLVYEDLSNIIVITITNPPRPLASRRVKYATKVCVQGIQLETHGKWLLIRNQLRNKHEIVKQKKKRKYAMQSDNEYDTDALP